MNENKSMFMHDPRFSSIRRLIAARGLKQRAAAKTLGVTQPRVNDLLRGRIDFFGLDALINIPARLGTTVRLTISVSRPACLSVAEYKLLRMPVTIFF